VRHLYLAAAVTLVAGGFAFFAIQSGIARQSPPPGIHAGEPPTNAVHVGAPSWMVPTPHIQASAHNYCADKRVSILWRYSETLPFEQATYTKDQEITTSFWPTAVEAVSNTKLLVAGKERDGDTRIELWTVTPPLLMQPAPGSTGPSELVLQPLASVDELYEHATVGRDMVRFLLRQRGTEAALLQFHDSRDIVSLHWGGAGPYTLTTILTPTTSPGLLSDLDVVTGGDHIANGYIYSFGRELDYGTVPWIVLFDADRDGAIESNTTMTPDQWITAGLDNLDLYVECAGL
jgi:hypothetical protein